MSMEKKAEGIPGGISVKKQSDMRGNYFAGKNFAQQNSTLSFVPNSVLSHENPHISYKKSLLLSFLANDRGFPLCHFLQGHNYFGYWFCYRGGVVWVEAEK